MIPSVGKTRESGQVDYIQVKHIPDITAGLKVKPTYSLGMVKLIGRN